jgi:chromosome segregation ATPase
VFTWVGQDAPVAKDKKTKKKKSASSIDKKSKGEVTKLRAQLAAAEKSAEKWKTRATSSKAERAGLKTQLTAVRRQLAKAEARAARWKDRATSSAPSPAAAPEPVASASPASGAAGPDESWTVTRLRAEARTRGVAGYSRKTKAQLLADLAR